MSAFSSADHEAIFRIGSIEVKWERFHGGAILQQARNTAEPAIGNCEAVQAYEFIDSKQLALRWNLPESWVREQVRTRSADPLPHVRFGKYVRFRLGSPELEAWAERRIVSSSNRVGGRALGKEST
jgi:hypothetical protein